MDFHKAPFAAAALVSVVLAALLDIEYRRLPGGEDNHSTVIALLDGEGRALARTEKPSGDEAFLERLKAAISP